MFRNDEVGSRDIVVVALVVVLFVVVVLSVGRGDDLVRDDDVEVILHLDDSTFLVLYL